MAFQADLSTDKLSVTEGAGGTVIAQIDSATRVSFALGKLTVGPPLAATDNALEVKGRLAVDGNVGVGTTAPAAKLDVNGNAFLGYETSIADFGAALKSGFYQNAGAKLAGDVPDTAHPWTHVIAARHSNTANNHQLQLAASYATNDKLYFRKIALLTTGASNPAWNEIATRASNAFTGDQSIQGSLATGAPNAGVKLAAGGSGVNVYATDAWVENNLHVQGNEPVAGGRGRLRVGTAWNYAGIYAEPASTGTNNDLVLGASSGRVRIGPDGTGQSLLVNGELRVNGNVGMGTTAPGRKLHVHSDTWDGNAGAEIHASGASAGFSFTDREAGRQWDNGGPGQRWVLYSGGCTARLWTSGAGRGDLMKVTSDGIPVFRNVGTLNDARARQILTGEAVHSCIIGVEAASQGNAIVYYWKAGDNRIRKAWDGGILI